MKNPSVPYILSLLLVLVSPADSIEPPKFILSQSHLCFRLEGLPDEIKVASLKIDPLKPLRTKVNEVIGVQGVLKFAGRAYPLSGACTFVHYDVWAEGQAMPFGGACHMQGGLSLGNALGAVGLDSVSLAMFVDLGEGPYRAALTRSRSDEAAGTQVKKYYPSLAPLKHCSAF